MQHNQSSRLQALAASAPPSKSPGCVQGSSHTSKRGGGGLGSSATVPTLLVLSCR